MNNKLLNRLLELVASKQLAFVELIENETEDHMQESETLVLTFPNGEEVKISTVCSGVLENTSLVLEE